MHLLENNNILIEFKNHGAELTRIFSKKYNKEILWNANPKYWGRHSPILFPIVGKLKDNETSIKDNLYSMTQHGFARDMDFEQVQITDNSVEYLLKSNEDTLKLYPYKFELKIIYTINDSYVDITWIVKNLDSSEMSFAIGAHPAFNLPFNESDKLNDYYLTFETNSNVGQYILKPPYVSHSINIDKIDNINLKADLFKNDALIYSNVNNITIHSNNEPLKIKVSFNDFPFVGIWSPYYSESDSIAPFICIEPWHGIADTWDCDKVFENKFGVNKLNPDEEFSASYQIEIQ